ncbi:unnamed protein product [Lactuca virosa]|uniref:HMA domain-containing protein n=1 Tax=Lactuca virosa TaxID=75947 RepID=A0AAU9LWJ5_9ASTR|nr:unnamed protein product [Lactuca virosa]
MRLPPITKEKVQTSNMTTPVTLTFQIVPFHNCEKSIRKVRKTLFKVGDVTIVSLNPNNGEVTIRSTSQSVEAIKSALERAFPTTQVFLLQEIVHQDAPSTFRRQQNPNQSTFDLSSVDRSLPVASDHVDGLQNVETDYSRINQSSTYTSASSFNNTPPTELSPHIQQSGNYYSWIYKIEEIDDD